MKLSKLEKRAIKTIAGYYFDTHLTDENLDSWRKFHTALFEVVDMVLKTEYGHTDLQLLIENGEIKTPEDVISYLENLNEKEIQSLEIKFE